MSANKWKDESSYSRSDKDRTPNAWVCRVGYMKASVHRHIHYAPDLWLLTCEPFFTRIGLKSKDATEAKNEASAMIAKTLRDALADVPQPE